MVESRVTRVEGRKTAACGSVRSRASTFDLQLSCSWSFRAHAIKCLVRRRVRVLQNQVCFIAVGCRGSISPGNEICRAFERVKPVGMVGELNLPDPVAESAGRVLRRRRQSDDDVADAAVCEDGIKIISSAA